MKILLVGPGIMSIPPKGWGAVEMLIWEYKLILEEMGHQIDIINSPDRETITRTANQCNYDFVHIHYDSFWDIIPQLKCKTRIISSHYPYINFPQQWNIDGYTNVLLGIRSQINDTQNNNHMFMSSQNDINTYINNGFNPERLFLSRLGINEDSYHYYDKPIYNSTLCLSKITNRKRQWILQNKGLDIKFIGKLDYGLFDPNSEDYLGEYDRTLLNESISKFSNFILLSAAENVTVLVIKEALVCGLGVIVSECCTSDLDTNLDFITVIPESRIDDIEYIADKIKENKEISVSKRNEIREYGIQEFSLRNTLKDYIDRIEAIKI